MTDVVKEVLGRKPIIASQGKINRDIVAETDELIATPKGFQEERRSGTWATVRYALKARKPVTVIWPDGAASLWIGNKK